MASRWRMNNTEVCCRRWFRLEVAQLQRASSEPWGRSTRIGCHWRPGRRKASGELKMKRKQLRISRSFTCTYADDERYFNWLINFDI